MQVKVWNDNTHVYEENFKGRDIKIEPKGYITMDKGDAQMFLKSFKNPQIKNGYPNPKYFKMLRIDTDMSAPKEDPKFVCNFCGYEAATQAELDLHIKNHHMDDILMDDDEKKEFMNGATV